MKHVRSILCGSAGLIALAGAAAWAQAQQAGTATYWMTAETSSGMGAAMAGGNPAAMVAALRGGNRPSFVHTLQLQLGTGRRPAGEPSAEHLPPVGLQAGASLPLVSPRGVNTVTVREREPWSPNGERPRGRMLIYWGCGEHVRAGQPVIFDFASMSAGRLPPAFASAGIRPSTPPSPATSATYGEWPNQKSQTRVPAGGSLVGEHVVRGNYTPDIRFTLAPGQDYLAPVALTANRKAASGSIPLVWRPVSGARAWLISTMGAAQNGDFVMWSSSETQVAAMMVDHQPDAELARLVQQRVLLPGTTDRCTVPSEVVAAAPQSMLSLIAFGGEANFSHPLRPARAPASWRPEWVVKLRTKSTHMAMLGMSMEEMMGQEEPNPPAPEEGQGSRLRRGLGKILGR